jgi:hypothetical protein
MKMPDESIIIPIEIPDTGALTALKNIEQAASVTVSKIEKGFHVSATSNVPVVMKQSEQSVRTLATAVSEATERINAGIDKMAADALRIPDSYKKAESSVKSFGINAGNAIAFVNKMQNQFAPGRGLDQFIAKGKQVEQQLQKLNPSSNQAAFALTNFGRIAQDLPYGLIGVANNITPLIESLQRLSSQAKETGVSMGKQLLNSLKGGGGLILGFSVLTSVMQFAAIGLSAFTRGMGGAGGAAGFAASEMEKVNEVLAKSAGSVQGQIAEINALVKAYGNTSSLKEQSRIISELSEKNKSFFGEMKAGKTSYDELTAAANAYTEALVNQAIVDGLKNAISKLAEEYGNLFIKYQDQTKAANAARVEMEKTSRANATNVQGMTAQNREVNLATNKFNNLNGSLNKTGKELGEISTRMNEFTDQIQIAVGKQLKFKPLKEGDKKDFEDKTDSIIAHARQFVKEFGDVFVLPDLEDSFFKSKTDILKAAQKLLDDVSKGNLKIKLPGVQFSALEGEVPFEMKPDPNFKFDEDGKIRASILEQMQKETQEIGVFDITLPTKVTIDLETDMRKKLDAAFKSGDFSGILDALDTDKREGFFKGLSDDIKISAGLINDTLTPAFEGLFDAIIKGENPLKAFFNSIIQSVNQVIKRLIAAAIQAAILSAVSGGSTSFGSAFGRLFGGGGGTANFGSRVGFAGGGAGAANFSMNAVLRGQDIYLSGVSGARSVSRAGG